MIDYLRAYKKNDPSAKSYLEIALLYPGPRALFFYRIANFLYRCRLFFFARFVAEFSRWVTLIEIHPGATIGKRLVIDHGSGIVIGETAEIGDDCVLYHGVTLGGVAYSPIKRHPTLGNRVMVGSGSKVLGPITLGDDSKVGSNAVLTKDLPSGKVALGIPARF